MFSNTKSTQIWKIDFDYLEQWEWCRRVSFNSFDRAFWTQTERNWSIKRYEANGLNNHLNFWEISLRGFDHILIEIENYCSMHCMGYVTSFHQNIYKIKFTVANSISNLFSNFFSNRFFYFVFPIGHFWYPWNLH